MQSFNDGAVGNAQKASLLELRHTHHTSLPAADPWTHVIAFNASRATVSAEILHDGIGSMLFHGLAAGFRSPRRRRLER